MINRFSLFLLIFSFSVVTACHSGKSSQSVTTDVPKFKVTIFYPNGDGKTFDMDYYEKKHMPMVTGFLGNNLKYYEIDKGLSGRTAEDKPSFIAIGYFYVSDIAEYNRAVGAHRDAIVSDFKNYTNIQPVIQISETKQVRK
ncbi:MAG: EthD family reductase [Flavobacterium sp.]|nr:MAG: EthD family reductase [Flavobacterium sp.]